MPTTLKVNGQAHTLEIDPSTPLLYVISNPEGVRKQAEGGVLQGMNRALVEQAIWDTRSVILIGPRTGTR